MDTVHESGVIPHLTQAVHKEDRGGVRFDIGRSGELRLANPDEFLERQRAHFHPRQIDRAQCRSNGFAVEFARRCRQGAHCGPVSIGARRDIRFRQRVALMARKRLSRRDFRDEAECLGQERFAAPRPDSFSPPGVLPCAFSRGYESLFSECSKSVPGSSRPR